MKKKGDTDMQLGGEVIDRAAVLSPAQVKAYVQPTKRIEVSPGKFKDVPVVTACTGRTEFDNGSIHVKSNHPLDACLRRSIIEPQHHDTGKAFITIRDCAFSNTHGRIYNDTGEGDSGIDAATLYTNAWRKMTKKQWALIELICFAQPRPDGAYFSEADYGALYRIAPNIQSAFEALEKAVMEARDEIKARIAAAEKIKAQ